MSVIVVGAEKNFAALRTRLFAGSVSNKTAGEVSSALQKANPHADLQKLEPGTVLFVPDDLAQVAVGSNLSLGGGATSGVTDMLAAAEAATEGLVAAVQSRVRADAAARKELLATLSRDEVAVAAKRDKAIGASLQAVQDALAAADAADAEAVAAVGEAQSAWAADLEALKAALPG